MLKPKTAAAALTSALVGLLALSGCGSATTTSSGSSPTSKASSGSSAPAPGSGSGTSQKVTTIRFGVLAPKADAGFDYMAQAQGFFTKHHLKVVFVPLKSSLSLNQALLAGKLDIAELSPGGALAIDAKSKTPPLKIIGASLPGMEHALFVKKGITSLQQMKGKTFATTTGAFSQVLMKLILKSANLSPNALTWVNINGSSGEEFQAVLAGKADASIGSIALQTKIPKNSGIHVLLRVAKVLPKYVRLTLVARTPFLQQHPDATVQFLEAEAQGIRYALNNKGAEMALAAKESQRKTTDPSLTLMYKTVVEGQLASPDLSIDPSRISYMEQLNIEGGRQKSMLPVSQVLDLSYQQKAISAIGSFKGQ